MDIVLIIVAVVAVIAVAALLFMRGRGGKREAGQEERRDAVPLGSGAPAAVKPPQRETKEAVARQTRAPAREEPAAVVEEAAAPPPVAEPPRPQVTEAEIRDQVRTRLEAAERMLGELREVAAGRAVDELTQSSGSVEIMAEGLQEVRALAERKQWSQAKNKGEALHAQLSLLLQSARRETAS